MSWIKPKGDNLGNHIATKDLNLNNFNILSPFEIKKLFGDINNTISAIKFDNINKELLITTINNYFTSYIKIRPNFIELSGRDYIKFISTGGFICDIPSKGQNKVLTCIDNNGNCEFREISGGSSDKFYNFLCSARGSTSGYISHFYKMDVNGQNSNTLSLTTPYEPFINDYQDPFVAPKNIKIIRVSGVVNHCAVSGGQGNNPKMVFNFYKNTGVNSTPNHRVLKGVIFIPVSSYETDHNLGGNNYQEFSVDVSHLDITFNQGETWGIQFQGYTSSEYIAVIKGCYLSILAQEI